MNKMAAMTKTRDLVPAPAQAPVCPRRESASHRMAAFIATAIRSPQGRTRLTTEYIGANAENSAATVHDRDAGQPLGLADPQRRERRRLPHARSSDAAKRT